MGYGYTILTNPIIIIVLMVIGTYVTIKRGR